MKDFIQNFIQNYDISSFSMTQSEDGSIIISIITTSKSLVQDKPHKRHRNNCKYIVIDQNTGNEYTFNSQSEVAKHLGVTAPLISNMCKSTSEDITYIKRL